MTTTTILSDNGVSSGSAGIKTTGGNDGTLALQTTTAGGAATTAVTIDTSQNVGIGTSSPSAKLNVVTAAAGNNLVLSNSGATPAAFYVYTGATSYGVSIGSGTAGSGEAINFNPSTNVVQFNTASTERMRIDSSGLIGMGCNTTGLNWSARLILSTNSGTTKWEVGPYATATNFIISAGASGGVYLAGTSATSWSVVSDERHKDIIEPITNAAEKVSSLRAVIGKYKDDSEENRKSFLIAQDVLAVLPEAVDTSNPDRFGLAYSDVIPLLVAAIQEQQAIIQTLEARLAALEAK